MLFSHHTEGIDILPTHELCNCGTCAYGSTICPFNQNSPNPSCLKWPMALNKSSSDIAFRSAKESQVAQWTQTGANSTLSCSNMSSNHGSGFLGLSLSYSGLQHCLKPMQIQRQINTIDSETPPRPSPLQRVCPGDHRPPIPPQPRPSQSSQHGCHNSSLQGFERAWPLQRMLSFLGDSCLRAIGLRSL